MQPKSNVVLTKILAFDFDLFIAKNNVFELKFGHLLLFFPLQRIITRIFEFIFHFSYNYRHAISTGSVWTHIVPKGNLVILYFPIL
jgi:hypothetical protein